MDEDVELALARLRLSVVESDKRLWSSETMEPRRLGGSIRDEEDSGLDLESLRACVRKPWPPSGVPSRSLELKERQCRPLRELMENDR